MAALQSRSEAGVSAVPLPSCIGYAGRNTHDFVPKSPQSYVVEALTAAPQAIGRAEMEDCEHGRLSSRRRIHVGAFRDGSDR